MIDVIKNESDQRDPTKKPKVSLWLNFSFIIMFMLVFLQTTVIYWFVSQPLIGP